MAEVLSVEVGERLRLTYPAAKYASYGEEIMDVVVIRRYAEDGAFDVELIEKKPDWWTDWTVFQGEVANGTVVVEKLADE